MAHFAKLDENNVVLEVVIVNNNDAKTEQDGIDFLITLYGGYNGWKQCSYNNGIRKQFPSKGYTYNMEFDVFVAPQPFPSWTIDGNHDWQPPTPKPTDEKYYIWNETNKSWDISHIMS